MRKYLWLGVLLLPALVFAADTKLTDLPSDGSPALTNVLYEVDDPSGAATPSKITIGAALGTGNDLNTSGEVTDDSHAHTTTSLSGIDIADDTDLAVDAPIVLTDVTLSLDVSSVTLQGNTVSGTDGTLITGTAGSNGHCAQWNSDGDVVTTGAACGTGSGTGGYEMEPATVTIQAAVGILASTLAISDISPASGTGLLSIDTSGDISSSTAFSTFYEYFGFKSPDHVFDGTTVVYEVSFASHPAFGKAEYDDSTDQATNCSFFDGDMIRNYDSAEAVRLENFSIFLGESADTGSSRFVVSVASVTNSQDPEAITFNQPINVDMIADATGASFDIQGSTAIVSLTNWNSELTAGAPFVISVCRDGDASQDSSTVNNYLRGFQIRVGKTSP